MTSMQWSSEPIVGQELETQRGSSMIAQVRRFLGVGAVNTVLTFIIYEVLVLITSYRVAYTISFVAGVCFATVAQSIIVFRARLRFWPVVRFVAFYLASYLVGIEVLTFLVERLGIAPALAPFLLVMIMLPLNFLGSRLAFRS